MNLRTATRSGLLLLALATLPGVALAYTSKGLVTKSPSQLVVALQRQTDKTGEAVLHLAAPVSYTGCPRVSNLEHTVNITTGNLEVDVKKFTIDFRNLPHAPGTPCKQSFQVSSADIPLDRKLIEDNKIKMISINVPGGLPGQIYDVTLEGDTLTLTPRPRKTFGIRGISHKATGPIEFRYYPKNTIVLSAPVAHGDARKKIVEDFAKSNDLVALSTVSEGFQPRSGHDEVYYYIDDRNRLNADAKDKIVGKNGDIDIYARIPNKYE
jgi:hypothetical protein